MSFQVWCFGMNFPNLTRKKEIGPWKTQILPSSNMSSETEWLHFILIAQRYMDTRECKDSATVQHVFLINWRCFKIIALTQRHLILLNAGCLASQVSLPLLLAAQEARCEWSILFVCVCVCFQDVAYTCCQFTWLHETNPPIKLLLLTQLFSLSIWYQHCVQVVVL